MDETSPKPPSAASQPPSPSAPSEAASRTPNVSSAGSVPRPEGEAQHQQSGALPAQATASPPPSDAKPKENVIRTLMGSTTAMITAVGALLAAITALVTALNNASWMRPPTPLPPTATLTPTIAWTATPPPTATPTLIVTAPAAVLSPSPASTPTRVGFALMEDFQRPPLDWLLEERSDYAIDVSDGELRIQVLEPDSAVWVRAPGTCALDDVIVEVDVRLAEGSEEGDAGITVREGKDSTLLAFLISGDGWYRVERLMNDEWESVIAWTESAAVRQGQTNRLRLEAVGPQMRFSVNEVLLAEIEEITLTTGCVGLMAVSWEDAFIEARFDNLGVSAP